jgi:aminoglycoside phosphotransferase (APT) family kinase protein
MTDHQPTGAPIAAIANWFAGVGIPFTGSLYADLIVGGRSNLTYKISDGAGQHWVLRRPPIEAALASAHDVVREYRIVAALEASAVPTAPTLAACTDTSLLGAAFAVYRYVSGQVLHTSAAAQELPIAERQSLGAHVFEVLAELHMVDPDAVGLADGATRRVH